MKYSIITPNYNGFKLMNRYFKSLEEQTFKDFEVIIVDDCSTDGSYQELKTYAKISSLEITVLQSEKNAGPGNARNIGMDAAKGEWITFVDNDDWIENTMLAEIDEIISHNDVNCVIYDYYIKREEKQSVARSMYSGETGALSLSDCMIYARNHTIGKFYKRSDCMAKNIRFPVLRRCEDVAFVARAIEACGKPFYYKKPLYYYYQRPISLSNNKKMDHSDMVKAFSILEETVGVRYPKEIAEKSVTDLLYGGLLMMCKAGKSNREIYMYIHEYEKKYPKWHEKDAVNKIGKGKKLFLICARYRFICGLRAFAFLHSKLISG